MPTPSFWVREKALLYSTLYPQVQDATKTGSTIAGAELQNLGIYVDNTLVNTELADYIRSHTEILTTWLNNTDVNIVGNILADWTEMPGSTLGDLVNSLNTVYMDRSRAVTVAITEVTRAVAGSQAIVFKEAGAGDTLLLPPAHPRCRCGIRLVRHQGKLVVVWRTSRDEAVCRTPINTPWGVVEGCRNLSRVVVSNGEFLGVKI